MGPELMNVTLRARPHARRAREPAGGASTRGDVQVLAISTDP
jgi:hypothetical protein